MNNLEVSTRLTMLIGVLSALLVAIGSLGLSGIGQSSDALKSVFEDRTVPAAQLGRINARVLHNRIALNAALVTPTPEVIKERTAKIESNVAAVMGEICAASAEQSAGVLQVGNAVNQMDQVTQRNAALVDERAATAESLKGQARQPVQTVAAFKLASDGSAQHVEHTTTMRSGTRRARLSS